MGMYTGLRVKAIVKDEFRQMIRNINEGEDWGDYVKQFPFLTSYSEQSRAEFIPRGSLAYMPDRWEKGEFSNYTDTDGFKRNIDMNNGRWTFQCSLKNYGQEIQQFFKEVFPRIVESAEHIEYYYEESSRSTFYELTNGEIVESSREGIQYAPDDEPAGYWEY